MKRGGGPEISGIIRQKLRHEIGKYHNQDMTGSDFVKMLGLLIHSSLQKVG